MISLYSAGQDAWYAWYAYLSYRLPVDPKITWHEVTWYQFWPWIFRDQQIHVLMRLEKRNTIVLKILFKRSSIKSYSRKAYDCWCRPDLRGQQLSSGQKKKFFRLCLVTGSTLLFSRSCSSIRGRMAGDPTSLYTSEAGKHRSRERVMRRKWTGTYGYATTLVLYFHAIMALGTRSALRMILLIIRPLHPFRSTLAEFGPVELCQSVSPV